MCSNFVHLCSNIIQLCFSRELVLNPERQTQLGNFTDLSLLLLVKLGQLRAVPIRPYQQGACQIQ